MFIIVYLDNILIYSNNLKEHVEYIKIVLIYLRNARLRLELDKCEFYKKEVEFLGYNIRIYRVRMSEDKIEVV